MATIDIATALTIPGLEPTLTKDDLKECTIITGDRWTSLDIEVDRSGTVILPKSAVNAREFLPTGWPGLLQPDDSNPPAGQAWANKVDEFHKVFINKPIGTARELVDELVHQDVLTPSALTLNATQYTARGGVTDRGQRES
ncbi:hypothetical protein MAC_06914 [Metarhizium acridum CQMa 102]|uniref:Uncharacterized protein n=1 Tax=Metarhizium acridum (strain CQMa 102) TaxID=655827 RepID=E9EAL6_METAQ|nr:uncharacterized protein MAC_06914 [Metarhizium acridum CQMa 102]EFY87016.1 hypothetical protein MAC_06914 [Metarhizium acridum CQMa 102]